MHPRLWLVTSFARVLPENSFERLRGRLLRLAGLHLGFAATFSGVPRLSGSGDIAGRLEIGEYVYVNTNAHFDLSDSISIGNHVSIGQDCLIVTKSHEIGGPEHRASTHSTAPVAIGDGAWLAARVTILPGVTVGSGAIVAAGAVVREDVAPNTAVGGVPATFLRALPDAARTDADVRSID